MDRFTPATDITRASVSNGQTVLLMASVILFALLCLGAAVVEMPGRWENMRAQHAAV
jgi:hypothetical protein